MSIPPINTQLAEKFHIVNHGKRGMEVQLRNGTMKFNTKPTECENFWTACAWCYMHYTQTKAELLTPTEKPIPKTRYTTNKCPICNEDVSSTKRMEMGGMYYFHDNAPTCIQSSVSFAAQQLEVNPKARAAIARTKGKF